jgi:hypothetical protein
MHTTVTIVKMGRDGKLVLLKPEKKKAECECTGLER